MNTDYQSWMDAHAQEHMELLLTLAQIPAPSNSEEKRAEFILNWLHANGGETAYMDEALNVILPFGVTEDNPLAVFAAHSDVVFPDTEPLPLRIEEGKIFCPGIGDDTASVAALLMGAKYLLETGLQPKKCGVLMVIDSGEEGLGNLRGIRHLFDTFDGRIREFISFDGGECRCVNRAVGSKRYRIAIETEGGHSYGAFGNRNAIAYLASLIDTLYTIKVPPIGKTTYNVGTISGGTSVNTIAQEAQMLFEFRSDEREGLAIMQAAFDGIVEEFRSNGVQIAVEVVGDRPCGLDVDNGPLAQRASAAVREYYGFSPALTSGSTDCNVPLSMGISAICPGCMMGAGAHTREEYVETDSLLPGLKVAFSLILHHF